MPSRRDHFSKAKRSEIMSRIRSRHTKLDIAMAEILAKNGFQYQMYPKVEGNPDFLVGQNVVIFCDSSFWHGRNWPSLRKQLLAGSNPQYWVRHIAKNRSRDRHVTRLLQMRGYTVLRFWDIEVFKKPGHCVRHIRQSLLG